MKWLAILVLTFMCFCLMSENDDQDKRIAKLEKQLSMQNTTENIIR